ncbi:winged helix-turn-helix domain-containing protein [Candidatus Rhodobacter oscarellae]|uniref:winged helix-turn-helix domain-containing protein n=1 Tax=Candidatus Rhodobacter oscarellae TaxID=1675527 RepID=UPI000A7A0A32|nr:winged helix-turn-helix domain-containing protein [Candidatus Rhodobacter lobularis]
MENLAGQQPAMSVGNAVYSPSSKLLTDSAGKEIRLRAKSVSVFEFLFANAGRLIPREEIIDQVWSGLEVTDDSLTQCISEIRKAIGDTKHSALQTVSKRGYKLNVEPLQPGNTPSETITQRDHSTVEVIDAFEGEGGSACLFIESAEDLMSYPLQSDNIRRVDTGTMLIFADVNQALEYVVSLRDGSFKAVGVTMGGPDALPVAQALAQLSTQGSVVASLSVWDAASTNPRVKFEDMGELLFKPNLGRGNVQIRAFNVVRVPGPAQVGNFTLNVLPTLAILPLRQGIEGETGGPLGLLFANSITQEFSRSHEINVISSMSTSAFIGQSMDLRDVRKMLSADFVLSGFWVEHGGEIQFNCEFSDTRTNRILWSDVISRPRGEHLDYLDAAYQAAGQIHRAIVLNETLKVQSQPLNSLEAYSILFGAIGLMHRLSPIEFKRARTLLSALIDRVPEHPTPLAWMARWHLLRVIQGWSDDPGHDSELAYACTARALDIDPNHTQALVSEGQVLTHLKRQLDDAEHRYNTALELNPNDTSGRMLRAMLLAFTDRGGEGLEDANLSLKLSPLDPHRFMNLALAAGVNLSAGDNETAAELARASYRMNRTHTSTLRMLAVAEARCGNMAQAQKITSELMRLQPGLTVSQWLSASPSASFINGQKFASDLKSLGVPE